MTGIASVAKYLAALSRILNRVSLYAAIGFLVLMLATVMFQVVARYIFFSPPAWTEELARYAMVWSGFLGATVSFYLKKDPSLTSTGAQPHKLHVTSQVLRFVAVVIFIGPIFIWSPTVLSHHALRVTETLGINSGYVFLIVPVSAALILFHAVTQVAETLADRFSTHQESA